LRSAVSRSAAMFSTLEEVVELARLPRARAG